MNRFPIPDTRFILFTGKGGVGKTTLACASAVSLADQGLRTLIVSTDPASNLSEVLGTLLGPYPVPLDGIANLWGLNIDPKAAAKQYRDRVMAPYREILPPAAIVQMEEGLSGACTTEIAAFDQFTGILVDEGTYATYDRIVFDTAPTGHTLRLLSLPSAWDSFIRAGQGNVSCLGPLATLGNQQAQCLESIRALQDGQRTTVLLVARPDATSLAVADRASSELASLGIQNQFLFINGVFPNGQSSDSIAQQFFDRTRVALGNIPESLRKIPRSLLLLRMRPVIGIEALRNLVLNCPESGDPVLPVYVPEDAVFEELVEAIAESPKGVILTMGKGGVGKTTVASALAVALASRGHRVLLTTTDPAATMEEWGRSEFDNLLVKRIDPKIEVQRYTSEVLAQSEGTLDAPGLALLAEELKSPCTEEVAVFRAFAEAVAEGESGFVVVDTAPTGHTILLLDAAESYRKEVSRNESSVPASVQFLLPRLRDPNFTKVLLITLPEPTPVHETGELREDLVRAGIEPFAVIVNQCLSLSGTQDPFLLAKASGEVSCIEEARGLASRLVLRPWKSGIEPDLNNLLM